jgi:hypothetical protein
VRHIDVFLRELTAQQEIGPLDVRRHARWLLAHAAHRNPLKFAIALVGISGEEEDLDDLRALARHDEFTLYAAVAAANLAEDAVEEWWGMARQVSGWGKVHLVERLCQHAGDRADVRGWLLRHGCANEVMNEYLALDCAVIGDLAGALAAEEIDDELLDGAGLIVAALLSPYGPAGNIDSYPASARALEHLVRHLEGRCDSLARLERVSQLAEWLAADDPEAWEARREAGWDDELRQDLLQVCQAVLARPGWRQRVRRAFRDDEEQRHRAWSLAPAVGLDLWEEAFARLTEDPTDGWLYHCLCREDDPGRLARLVAFAEEHLPLAEVATGPADLLGLGAGFEAHGCLDGLLQRMAQGDVFSEALVAAALRSPVVRNRHLAAGVLEVRDPALWGEAVAAALARTADDEVEEKLKERWRQLRGRLGQEE